MTARWAATNTLRSIVERDVSFYRQQEGNAALALVEAALDAAATRVAYGHNDTCDTELSPGSGYACTCGHDTLAAALRAVREGK